MLLPLMRIGLMSEHDFRVSATSLSSVYYYHINRNWFCYSDCLSSLEPMHDLVSLGLERFPTAQNSSSLFSLLRLIINNMLARFVTPPNNNGGDSYAEEVFCQGDGQKSPLVSRRRRRAKFWGKGGSDINIARNIASFCRFFPLARLTQ